MEGRAHTKPQSSICLSLGSRLPVRSPSMRPEMPLLTPVAAIWPDPHRERSRSLKPCLLTAEFRPSRKPDSRTARRWLPAPRRYHVSLFNG